MRWNCVRIIFNRSRLITHLCIYNLSSLSRILRKAQFKWRMAATVKAYSWSCKKQFLLSDWTPLYRLFELTKYFVSHYHYYYVLLIKDSNRQPYLVWIGHRTRCCHFQNVQNIVESSTMPTKKPKTKWREKRNRSCACMCSSVAETWDIVGVYIHRRVFTMHVLQASM